MAQLPPTSSQRGTLVVVGESCRALARSCRAAGWDVSAIDRYGDRDLLAVCQRFHSWPTVAVDPAPPLGPLWPAMCELPAGPILPAGGMEQSHRAPRQLPPGCTYCGPQGEQLDRLRDVRQWRRWAKQSGLHFPNTQFCYTDKLGHARDWPAGWLIKRSDSGGGLGVRSVVELVRNTASDIPGSACAPTWAAATYHYYQQRLPGPTIGVVLASSASGSGVLGASLAVESHQWPGPRQFIYRGSCGPIELPQHLLVRLRRLAELVAEHTGIRGVWGVDLARGRQGDWCLLEINPRWSASMEIIELASGDNLAAVHLDAWGWPAPTQPAHDRPATTQTADQSPACNRRDALGSPQLELPREAQPGSPVRLLKLVIYCRRTFQVTQQQSDALFAHRLPEPTSAEAVHLISQSAAGWRLADIPKAGDYVPRGAPLMTLLVWGPRKQLWQIAHRVRQHRLPPLFLDGRSKV
jgi:predicted ATP-grasp superfamily ATP-dependent carboligase